jgi:hypothetical protein
MIDSKSLLAFRCDLQLNPERFGIAHAPKIPNYKLTH